MEMYKYDEEEVKLLDKLLNLLSQGTRESVIIRNDLYENSTLEREKIDELLLILSKEGYIENGFSNIISISYGGMRFLKKGGFKLDKEKFEKESQEAEFDKKINRTSQISSVLLNVIKIVGVVVSIVYTIIDVVINLIYEEGVFSLFLKLIK